LNINQQKCVFYNLKNFHLCEQATK
jgi:hypothetical protein